MGAMPAYSRYYNAAPERQPRPQRRIDVVPGGAPRTQSRPVPSIGVAVKAFLAVCVVLVALCFVRVWLISSTVTTELETRSISTQLDDARSSGKDLEVVQSSLSNPARIKAEATALGMHAPLETEALYLGTDVVALDESGDISLTQSLRLASAS